MRITDGTTATISFTPGRYRRPDLLFETHNEAIDGTLSIYKRGATKEFHEVEVVFATATGARHLNTWAASHATITFTHDMGGTGSTAITARMVNRSRPMQMWDETWDKLYTGTLMIREI